MLKDFLALTKRSEARRSRSRRASTLGHLITRFLQSWSDYRSAATTAFAFDLGGWVIVTVYPLGHYLIRRRFALVFVLTSSPSSSSSASSYLLHPATLHSRAKHQRTFTIVKALPSSPHPSSLRFHFIPIPFVPRLPDNFLESHPYLTPPSILCAIERSAVLVTSYLSMSLTYSSFIFWTFLL